MDLEKYVQEEKNTRKKSLVYKGVRKDFIKKAILKLSNK